MTSEAVVRLLWCAYAKLAPQGTRQPVKMVSFLLERKRKIRMMIMNQAQPAVFSQHRCDAELFLLVTEEGPVTARCPRGLRDARPAQTLRGRRWHTGAQAHGCVVTVP